MVKIFDRVDNSIYPAGAMEYEGPISMVYLKDYPVAVSDRNYMAREDSFVHLFVDPADGMNRTSVPNLISYSYDSGCVDVLLQMLPHFLGAEFSAPEGVFSVWCSEGTILYNDASISLKDLLQTEEMSYTAMLKQ